MMSDDEHVEQDEQDEKDTKSEPAKKDTGPRPRGRTFGGSGVEKRG